MGSKIFITGILILSLFSCKRSEDAMNQIRIFNKTNDTIVFFFKRNYSHIDTIKPKDTFFFAMAVYISDYDIIEDNWCETGDTIGIQKLNDTLTVKWGAPLRDLPDSIHSFYNKNSWVIEKGGLKNKWTIATFTITEDDFRK